MLVLVLVMVVVLVLALMLLVWCGVMLWCESVPVQPLPLERHHPQSLAVPWLLMRASAPAP